MTTRYLIAAAFLFASACGARADVLPATSTTQSTFLTGWTSNGTDVVSSGVLGTGTTLVGGATYGSGNVVQALYQQASANVASTGGQVKLSYSTGVTGTYVVGTSNFKLAAMLGDAAQVVSGNDGATVSTGGTTTTSSANTAAPGGTSAAAPSTVSTSTGGSAAGTTTNNQTAGTGTTGGASGDQTVALPSDVSGGTSLGATAPALALAASGNVPEPSSIALLMAGMMGALALNRRRKR